MTESIGDGSDDSDGLGASLRPLQIIIFAFGMGVALFLAVVVFMIKPERDPQAEQFSFLLPVLFGMGIVQLPMYFIVRSGILGQMPKPDSSATITEENRQKALLLLRGLTLMAGAFAEGLGLFGVVVYMITGESIACLAAAICFGCLAVIFPTRQKFEAKIEKYCGVVPQIRLD